MQRALAVLAFGLVALDPGAGWTQGEHRHRPPSEIPGPNEQQVNTYTTGDQDDPDVTTRPGPIGDGTPLVVWSSDGQDGSGRGIYARAPGMGGFGELRVNSYTTGDQEEPSVVGTDFAGDFVVVWTSPQDGSGRGVFGQRFAPSGAPVGPEFQVNTFTTGDQYQATVTVLSAAGDFVVVWDSVGQDGSGHGLYGQRYSAGGAPLGPEFRVNTYTNGAQYRAAAAPRAETGWTRFPVVERDSERKLLGMVSLTDLLKARTHNLEAERRRERVLRLDLLLPPRTRPRQGGEEGPPSPG